MYRVARQNVLMVYSMLIACLVVLPQSSLTHAQSTSELVAISGKVTITGTEEPLTGVTVIIKGTSFGDATDIDGRYEINNIRAGEYSVELSFIGFERKLLTGIVVASGEKRKMQL